MLVCLIKNNPEKNPTGVNGLMVKVLDYLEAVKIHP